MEDIKTIERKIQLKRQAIHMIMDEIRELKFRKSLLSEKDRMEGKMGDLFDPARSLKLDCVIGLLEN